MRWVSDDRPSAEFIPQKGRLLPLAERVDPRSTALIIVDVQNDFCDPDGVFGKLGADVSMMPAMADKLRNLLEAARRKDMLILWVRATYDAAVTSNTLAETYHRRGFTQSQCLDGSWGAAWFGVSPRTAPNEIELSKHRFSPFWDTAIDVFLRSNAIRSVIVTGVVTSGCVDSTARDAFFNDYYVVVAEDCVAEASQDRHEAALRKLAQSFGVVLPAAELIAVWDASECRAESWRLQSKRARMLRDRQARLHPGHTALVLIDARDGATAQTAALLRQARANRVMVVHVDSDLSEASTSDVQLFLQQGAVAGSASEPAAEAAPRGDEQTIVKHRLDAFVDTGMEKLLRVNGIRTVVIAGHDTPGAIDSSARQAAMRDFYVVVAEDCVTPRANQQHLHQASLQTLAARFADVCTASAVTDCWAAATG
jgi:ureidoacrylate peracid hydrolase